MANIQRECANNPTSRGKTGTGQLQKYNSYRNTVLQQTSQFSYKILLACKVRQHILTGGQSSPEQPHMHGCIPFYSRAGIILEEHMQIGLGAPHNKEILRTSHSITDPF